MTVIYTEEQVISKVPGLDRPLLVRFVNARIVIPVERPAEKARGFLPVDVARLSLACELCDNFEFEDDALGVVMQLVDHLHATRADLRAVLEAIVDLPDVHKMAIAERVQRKRSQPAD